ncbi:hypothetical protein [Lactococcus sp. dk310]|uniref:hypothetical protein n=2 Tax=Lactococcus TaxID=1357 RepID=UPI0011CB15BD|nr:hypothetical protein [Lactococcus sp. dk310]TXK37367.1 hypothetical protein FVP42_09065 [Lactococcus sp. dk310]
MGQVPWIIGWYDSRRPYPPFSSAGYGTPLVNLLNGIGLVLLVVTVLSYGYKKRNLFWCLFPFGLGNVLFVLTSQIRKQSR